MWGAGYLANPYYGKSHFGGVHWIRTHTDSVTAGEPSFVKSLQRLFSDSMTLVESLVKQSQRLLTDSITAAESYFNKQIQRLVTDTITLVESFSRYWLAFKTFTETITLGEVFSKFLPRSLTDSFAIVESAFKLYLNGVLIRWWKIAQPLSTVWSKIVQAVISWTKQEKTTASFTKVERSTATFSKGAKPSASWSKVEKPET